MNRKTMLALLAASLAAAMLTAQEGDTIYIHNATIVPVAGKPFSNGSLLIEKGRIARIGNAVPAPAKALIIDAKGMFVYPGMVAPLTAIGLTNFPGQASDINETGVSTPQIDPFDALNPEDDCIEVARLGGVTTVLTAAGSSKVISGKALVLNLDGHLPGDMVMRRDVLQVFNIGARAENKYPSTLPGIMAFLREKLEMARLYAGRAKAAVSGETVLRDFELEALVPVVKREMPVLIMTSDEVTIHAALELIEEFGLRGILFASAGIQKYADQLAAKKIPVIWGGTTTMPRRWEPVDVNYHTATVLAQKGVLFALSESDGQGSRNVRNQPFPAAISVAYGLPEEEAIKALTLNPAKILGIEGRVGSLEVGKMANIVICSKSLVQMSNRIATVIIGGRVIPPVSLQTRLNEKYAKIVRERMQGQKK